MTAGGAVVEALADLAHQLVQAALLAAVAGRPDVMAIGLVSIHDTVGDRPAPGALAVIPMVGPPVSLAAWLLWQEVGGVWAAPPAVAAEVR